MRFKIYGANKDTAEDVEVIIEANTPSAAQEKANQLNLMVERIEVADLPAPIARPIQQMTQATQLTPPVVVRPVQMVQTIEKTGKTIKFCMMLSVVAIAVGIGIALGFSDDPTTRNGGISIFCLGFWGYILCRVFAWWYHG